MEIRFERWDLVAAQSRRPVLRIAIDGAVQSDEGCQDCFVGPLTAAEAAWWLSGRAPEASSGWLEAAHEALAGEPRGTMDAHDPARRLRIITASLMDADGVEWLTRQDASLASAGDWKFRGEAGISVVESVEFDLQFAAVNTLDPPLSGNRTDVWPMIEEAGVAVGSQVPVMERTDSELGPVGSDLSVLPGFERRNRAPDPPPEED